MADGLEYDAVENGQVGRDPREMSEDDLNALGHHKQPLRKVIREKCLDCCGQQQAEVRRCVSVTCALWPYRMNSNPFAGRDMTDEQRAEMERAPPAIAFRP